MISYAVFCLKKKNRSTAVVFIESKMQYWTVNRNLSIGDITT